MWAGSAGYTVVAAAERVGLLDEQPGRTTTDSARILRASRAVVGLWCAAALALLVVVASRLVGRRAALIGGVLLAAEPFLVGHSNVLHTDALVTMFGTLAVIGLAAALPEDGGSPDRKLLLLAGAAAGIAALTKLNAVPLVLGGAAVVLIFRTDWRDGWRTALPRVLRVAITFLGVAFALFFVAWPALWVDFVSELQRLPNSLDQLSKDRTTFFRYEQTTDPGPLFYPYALAFRLSPWLFVGALVSAVTVAVHLLLPRRRDRSGWPARSALAVLLLAPLPYALLITFTAQKYDRYVLPLVPYLALATGVVAAVAAERWVARFGGRLLAAAAAAATFAVLAVTASAQPYTISYANPLLGGQARARNNILLGWGEGLEVLGAEIRARESDRCSEVAIWAPAFFADFIALPCGQVRGGLKVEEYDYVIVYIANVQRSDSLALMQKARSAGKLVKEVKIGGFTYAELWKVKR
jgi:4-amino-4-deoxy-L-arabinose transferase-like glycosyltransferase